MNTKLIEFLDAIKNMPVYSNYLGGVDFCELRQNPEKVYDVIQRFPIINKNIVKDNLQSFTNSAYDGKVMEMRTSGTTGGGLVFPYSIDMENKQWAIWWRYRLRLGITLDTWCGWFGGKTIVGKNVKEGPFFRINRPGKQAMFSTYHLTSRTVADYVSEISKRKIEWLHGYPSHIAKLASLMIDEGLAPLLNVRFVTTGAENVLGNQLALIRKAFPNAIVRQHYGLNEGVANISQDINGNWKIDEDFCYVEFIPRGDLPNVYSIIGTGFSNEAFPLVRYDTGDLATIIDGKIISIDGRSSNVIKQPGGHDICEASLSILLHDFNDIREAQFHQTGLTTLELWVVKGKMYNSEVEKKLIENMNNLLDESMNVTIKYVDSVERTKAGKLKLVISEF